MTQLFPARASRRPRERSPGLLFAFGVDDVSLDVPTGHTLTFNRDSGRTVFDSSGRVASLVNDQVPWSAVYNEVADVWEPVYDAQSSTANLCLRSEDFGTTWSGIGTPTRTAAAKQCGDLVLDLIGDDAAGTLEGYSQVVTFTGNATKAVSVFIAEGTSVSSVIRLRDTSAGADRLLATVTWVAGVPSVAMTTGSHFGTVACFDGVYRLQFQTATVTAANTNQIEVYPATDAALATSDTGTLYVGGVMCENATRARTYVKTLGTVATTQSDVLTGTVSLPIGDFTVFARVSRPSWAGATGGVSPQIFGGPLTSGSVGSGVWHVYYNPSSTMTVTAEITDLSTPASASANLPATNAFDICAQFRNLTTGAQVRLDVGAGFGAWSSAGPALTGWDSTSIGIGCIPGVTSSAADAGIRRGAIAAGQRTLTELRGAQP